MSSSDPSWGSGWPHGAIVPISNFTYNGIPFPAGLATELHELALILLAETEKRGYAVHPGWNWGYANRAIAGTNTASNHSKGTALDINAPVNGRGTKGTFPPAIAHEVWNPCGWEWGGDWGYTDPMHVEFIPARSKVAEMTDKAKRLFGGGEDDLTPEQETFLKELMKKMGGTPKGAADRIAAVVNAAKPLEAPKG